MSLIGDWSSMESCFDGGGAAFAGSTFLRAYVGVGAAACRSPTEKNLEAGDNVREAAAREMSGLKNLGIEQTPDSAERVALGINVAIFNVVRCGGRGVREYEAFRDRASGRPRGVPF
jgi:hypothetical protein